MFRVPQVLESSGRRLHFYTRINIAVTWSVQCLPGRRTSHRRLAAPHSSVSRIDLEGPVGREVLAVPRCSHGLVTSEGRRWFLGLVRGSCNAGTVEAEGGNGATVKPVWIGLVIAAILTAPIVLLMFSEANIFGDRRGTAGFYEAAAQAIPTLVVAFAIELRVFTRQLRRITLLSPTGIFVILTIFLLLVVGQVAALDAISCEPFRQCVDTSHFQRVCLALIAGAALVFATLTMALFQVEDE